MKKKRILTESGLATFEIILWN